MNKQNLTKFISNKDKIESLIFNQISKFQKNIG